MRTHPDYSLVAVSPDAESGRGGISSSVAALSQSEELLARGARFLVSHSHGTRLASVARACRALRALRDRDRVLWLHCGPWLSMSRKIALAWIGYDSRQVTILHLHSPTLEGYLRNPCSRRLLRVVFDHADGIIVLTPWWKSLVLNYLPHLAGKVTVVPNAISPAFEQIARRDRDAIPSRHGPTGTITILCMARLVREKMVDAVIRALACLPTDYALVVAGDGPARQELVDLASSMGLGQRVSFAGWVDSEAKLELLRKCDVFCLPSRYDSFGMSFVEAMAAGVPVVALRQGAIPDVVIDGVSGILVDSTLEDDVAAGILRAVAGRSHLVPAARQQVLNSYALGEVSAKLVAFFDARWSSRAPSG